MGSLPAFPDSDQPQITQIQKNQLWKAGREENTDLDSANSVHSVQVPFSWFPAFLIRLTITGNFASPRFVID